MAELTSDPVFWQFVAVVGPFIAYALIGATMFGVAGAFMLNRADREFAGFLLGFFLGPVGLVIAWVMRDNALREEAADRARRHRALDVAETSLAGARRTGFGPSHVPTLADTTPNRHADVDALERLAKLREAGHLTDEEFQAKKRQILAGISATGGYTPRSQPAAPQPRRFR